MSQFTVTLGSTSNTPNAGFSDPYSTNYTYSLTTGTNFTGAISPPDDTGRPFLITSLRIYFQSDSAGTGKFACSNGVSLNGTVTSESANIGDLDNTIDRVLSYPGYRNVEFYYGFIKTNTETTNFYRGSQSGSNVYSDGTIMESSTTRFTNSAIYARITFNSIPSAVQSLSASATGNSIEVNWSAPSDDGGSNVSITGTRVSWKPRSGTIWSHHEVNAFSTSYTIDNLSDNTEYDIRVGALNQVTDRHNSEYSYSGNTYMTGTAATTTATTESSAPDVNITNGIDISVVRRGQSSTYADRIIATNKRSDYDDNDGDWSLSGTRASYFKINSLSSFDYIGYDIPSNATIGKFDLTLTAFGPNSEDTDVAEIEIKYPLPDFTDDTLGDGRVGVSYDESISGDSSTSSWIISENIPGVSFSTDGATATFAGTPTNFGNYQVTATLRNEGNESGESRTISVTIEDAELSWADQSLSTTTVVQKDTGYSDGVAVNSGPISVAYSVTPGESLPTGLNLNSSTGALTVDSVNGITADAGTYSFRIRATNGTNEFIDTQTLSLTVEQAGGFMKVWNGASWVEAPATVWNGSSWVEGTVKVWNGSAWVESFSS